MSDHPPQASPPPEKYVSIDELASLMGVSRSTIKRWRAQGMPAETWGVRVVRFRASEAIAWARAQEQTRD